jgi:hypothetical protein
MIGEFELLRIISALEKIADEAERIANRLDNFEKTVTDLADTTSEVWLWFASERRKSSAEGANVETLANDFAKLLTAVEASGEEPLDPWDGTPPEERYRGLQKR